MIKKVYLSGKITGLDLGEAIANFQSMARHVKSTGHHPVNPMEILAFHIDLTWQDYMKADIKALCDCHEILLHPNWKDSKGAKLEHEIAVNLGLEVKHFKI